MNWHQSWTQKPSRVFFTLTGLLVLLAVSSLSIPLGYLPGSAKKSIMIRLEYKGAFENQIEKVITNPMEEELSKIAGIKELFSVSEQEKSSINITFFPEINLDEAYLRVREEVDYVYSALPEGVQRPVISKSDINDRPVFIAAFEKKPYLTEDYLKRVFENIKGTGEIEVGGGFKEEVRITFLPENLSLSNITLQDLISSLRSSNIIGSFGKQTDIPHTLDGRLETIESIEDLYITSSIKLKEVAEVHLTEARKESIGRVQGKEKIIIYVHKSGDANTVNLCRKLTSLIDEFPEAQVIYNYGEKIEESLGEIFISIIFGIIFVTLLTFLFIRKFYPAILVSLNIPFSTLFAVACLNGLGYEINIMTLSGIAIAMPAKEITFKDMWVININRKTDAMEIGIDIMVITGMIPSLKRRKRTTRAAEMPKPMEINKLRTDKRISLDPSSITSICKSFLKLFFISKSSFRILLAAFRLPMLPVLLIKIPTASLPFMWKKEVFSFSPK